MSKRPNLSTNMRQTLAIAVLLGAIVTGDSSLFAQQLPVLHQDDFEAAGALSKWLPTQSDKWKITKTNSKQGKVLHLLGASKSYKPPFRSPLSITLLKGQVVGDFILTAKVQTLQTARGHRDMCIFFGWQDPSHFYYVHLGEKPDPNSSQIFIVKNAPRTPITEKNAGGIPWKDNRWHDVKVVRNVKDGLIAVYFDDMETPVKVAHDKTFQWGMLGLGSFDDLGQWDDVVIRGTTVSDQKPVLPKKMGLNHEHRPRNLAERRVRRQQYRTGCFCSVRSCHRR